MEAIFEITDLVERHKTTQAQALLHGIIESETATLRAQLDEAHEAKERAERLCAVTEQANAAIISQLAAKDRVIEGLRKVAEKVEREGHSRNCSFREYDTPCDCALKIARTALAAAPASEPGKETPSE